MVFYSMIFGFLMVQLVMCFIEIQKLCIINLINLIFHHGWRQLTWRVRHDVFWRPWRFWCFLTFFEVDWRFLEFRKISKNFWQKLTLASIEKPLQLTSAKVIWRQLTTIDVKWLQTWCFLTPFDVVRWILTIFENKNLIFFPNYAYLKYFMITDIF